MAPTKRVNVALPFSTMRIAETSPDLAELTSIVAELAGLLDEAHAGTGFHDVRVRAGALVARLR